MTNKKKKSYLILGSTQNSTDRNTAANMKSFAVVGNHNKTDTPVWASTNGGVEKYGNIKSGKKEQLNYQDNSIRR